MNEKLKLLVKRCHQRVSVQPAQNVGAYRGLDRDPRKIEISGTVRGTLMAASVILRRSSRREWTLHSQSYRGP